MPGKRVMFAAVASFLLLVGLMFPTMARAQLYTTEDSDQVSLEVIQPTQAVSNEPVKVGISYTMRRHGQMGTAVVDYHNVDTGETFTKTVDILLTRGTHKVDAVWDASETLPGGLYVIKVRILDSDGKQLAMYETNPDQVKTLIMVGRATRMVDLDKLKAKIALWPQWQAELEALEARAQAAGADTRRQHLMIEVLKQTQFWTREKMGGKAYGVVEVNHEFFTEAVPKVKAELERLIENPKAFFQYPQTPRPEGRYTIKDGYWHAGDQPVFLNGPCYFGFTLPYLADARKLGFNVVEISLGPDSIFPDSEEPTGTARIDPKIKKGNELVAILDQCQALGLKVDLGLTPHFLDDWVYEKWPDARNKFVLYGMMPYDIEHPDMLKLIETFYETVMPQIAGHPALNSIWIANEPEYMNPNERNMAIFRPWLKKKYETIEALNEAWGTKLSSFDEIVASGRKGNPVPDAASTDAAKYDWWKYSTERLMRHWDWQKSLIRKYEPDLPVAVKLYNGTFNPQFKPVSRADEESSYDHMDYIGLSGGSFPFSKSYKDFMRSVDPSKPLANLEYKFGGLRAKLDFWQETMQGCSHIDLWCWHPNHAFSPVPSDARSMYYAALDTMDIQRLLPQVMAFNKLPRSPFVMLYPDPSSPRYWEYFAISNPTNTVLTKMGYYQIDYASEKRIAQGRLDDYKMLIMPAADFIRDDTYEKVKAFIEKGGTAVVLGAIPEHDEMSKPRDASLFAPHGDVQTLTVGDFKASKFSAGKGTIYLLPQLPRTDDGKNHLAKDAPKVIDQYLEQVLEAELPQQPVKIRGYENGTIPYTNSAGQKTYITYMVNDWLDSGVVVKPQYNFKVKSCRDLITGDVLDPAGITIPAADVRLVEFIIDQ